MATEAATTAPKTSTQFFNERNDNMSKVLQEVQEDFKKATERTHLDHITLKLQKLITDDLKLQSEEKEMAFNKRYRTYSIWRGDRPVDDYYRDTCLHFSLDMLVNLHRMYAKTAAALYEAMSQRAPHGKSQNYQATEALAQSEKFKEALRDVPDGYNYWVPQIPDGVTTTDLPSRAEMGTIHTLLTRLKGV